MNFAAKFILATGLLGAFAAQAANVAVIAPKVGPMAKFGRELADGAQTAVDDINQNGGIMGEKINLITVDDRCEDSFAVSAAQMMSINSSESDRVSLVIGPYCDNVFTRVSQIYAAGKIVRIVPMPLDSAKYRLDEPGLIKIGGIMSEEAKTFFDFYSQNFTGKNVAMAYDASLPAAAEAAFKVQELFREHGLSNRITLYDLSAGEEDYGQTAKEILLNNQIVYILSRPEATARLAQQLQEENADTVILIDEYMATPYFFRELGNFSEGIYVLTKEDMKDSPSFTEELVKLRLRGREPRGLGVYGYAAVKLWGEMAVRAKSTDFDKINVLRSGTQFNLPWGTVDFDSGNALQSSGYQVYRIVDGEYAQVD